MDKCLLGLDLGTTHCKATVYDVDGRPVSEALAPIEADTRRPGTTEQHPDDWIAACERVISLVAHESRVPIGAVGLSSRMGSLVYLDDNDRPLVPATLYVDARGAHHRRALIEGGQVETLGLNLLNTVPRMIWMREHRPEILRATARVCGAKDFIGAWLTGVYATDFSSGPGLGPWPDIVSDMAGLRPGALPPVVPSTTVLGSIRPSIAGDIGLHSSTLVVIGASDGACANLGVGAIDPDDVCISLSTTGVVRVASGSQPHLVPLARMSGFAYPLDQNIWFSGGVVTTAGAALSWLQMMLGIETFDEMMAEAAAIPAGSDGLMFAPYLQGMYSPEYRPHEHGEFRGLRLIHRRPHLIRSVMEGVVYSVRAVMDALGIHGTTVPYAALTGGAVRSPLWRQITADVLACDLNYHADGTSLGAAMLAGIGVGAYHGIQEAQAAMGMPGIAVNVGPAVTAYKQQYQRFREVVNLKGDA